VLEIVLQTIAIAIECKSKKSGQMQVTHQRGLDVGGDLGLHRVHQRLQLSRRLDLGLRKGSKQHTNVSLSASRNQPRQV
jgi:hypothetical protein